jgi:hypothetical protein
MGAVFVGRGFLIAASIWSAADIQWRSAWSELIRESPIASGRYNIENVPTSAQMREAWRYRSNFNLARVTTHTHPERNRQRESLLLVSSD